MEPARAQSVWQTLDTLLTVGTLGAMTDGQLLDCFWSSREAAGQEAFRILVDRHGPMVLGLCRSLIRDPHEAEDAFQATFLVLVSKADSIRRRETIGPWLYGVACRVARRARNRSNRRRRREVPVIADIPIPDDPAAEARGTELAVQEEIARLPESFRAPILLCCLQGLSYDLAACRLGVSEPTFRGRLHRARKQLASRLRRRGILAPVIARVLEPTGIPLPAISSSLIESTVQFATRWSAVRGLLVGATAVPESIAALAQGVIQAMLLQSVKLFGIAAILTVGVVGTVVIAQQEKDTAAKPAAPPVAAKDKPSSNSEPRDRPSPQELKEKTRVIEQILDQPIDLGLEGDVKLDQLLKRIKEVTTRHPYKGIPIYVAPWGLQEADVSMETQVVVPSKFAPGMTTLRQVLFGALHPWKLSYVVKDGFLMIDSRAAITEMRVAEVERKLDRVLDVLERLEKSK
jgi:RNA polymerase sigma factor (sigma-70 family)